MLLDVLRPGGRGAKRWELGLRRLRRDIDATIDRRTGVLTIEVRAPDPVIAAGVANATDSLLQEFLIRSAASQASHERKFIEDRMTDTQIRLSRCEDALKAFREQNLRIGNSPRLLIEEGRLLRALREQEEVYLTLRREYEVARINERRDTPTISVLDVATAPAFHHWPPRRAFAIAGAIAGLLLGSAWIARAHQGFERTGAAEAMSDGTPA